MIRLKVQKKELAKQRLRSNQQQRRKRHSLLQRQEAFLADGSKKDKTASKGLKEYLKVSNKVNLANSQ